MHLAFEAPVGLLPVVLFLAALLYFDSYKLVRVQVVLLVIALGGIGAFAAYLLHAPLLEWLDLDKASYSRYVAPPVEELIKALVVVYLLQTHRIGFLVDAAIFGFAAGAGFALVENLYYMNLIPDAHMGVWIVRGFGTAIMHGGVSAVFAIVSYALIERTSGTNVLNYVPGFLIAAVIHSLFNHFFLSPVMSTILILAVLPPVVYLVFKRSERSVDGWLNVGFDADAELLELINSGELSDSRIGIYLNSLKEKFRGEVVADMLCYLRLHAELALRAKGVMMMRESGFDVEPDPEVRAGLEEMVYLEKSIGRTGRLAMKPFLHISRKDLWQLYMLGK